MNVDYDGINYDFQAQLHHDAKQLLTALAEEFPSVQIPTRWEICDYCDGDGCHSKHLGVIDPEDWYADEFDDYLAGRYDTICTKCNGTGKVREIDDERLPQHVQQFIIQYWDDAYECAQISRMERLMGA